MNALKAITKTDAYKETVILGILLLVCIPVCVFGILLMILPFGFYGLIYFFSYLDKEKPPSPISLLAYVVEAVLVIYKFYFDPDFKAPILSYIMGMDIVFNYIVFGLIATIKSGIVPNHVKRFVSQYKEARKENG